LGALLGALSSLLYGVADFLGGQGAKKVTASTVVVWAGVVSFPLICVVALSIGGEASPPDIVLGALGGALGALGLVSLFAGLGRGQAAAVAPAAAAMGAVVPVVFAVVAYVKDPSLPMVGARNGLALLWFIIPRLVPALILAGMLQVVIPQETVARYFGRQSGLSAICMASVAGVITPGGPMVSVPLLVVLSNSGMALGPLVAYMTAWSLFGMQRIIAWEAPLMGWHFVAVRTASSLVFPIIAGWLVTLYFHE